MTSQEIRKKFVDYFEKHEHAVVFSSSLLPDDPSVLFTTAGMQQFKPYYVGKADVVKDFGKWSTTSVQKCVRTGDIEEVGDERHLTFFEMLGNFSFGGYFKKEAIHFAHEFITKEMGLTIDYVTVFEGEFGEKGNVPADTESEAIWKSIDPDIVIKRFSRADNFWGPTGDEGPCGPTTEIYVDGIEIWNVVFNQYFQHKDKTLEPLVLPGIDTGMGLERLVLVKQFPGEAGRKTIFETDLFGPLLEKIKKYIPNPLDGTRSHRIIADHFRTAIFLALDGVRPSNKDQGFILRRLIRRATVHSLVMGFDGVSNISDFEDLVNKSNGQRSGFVEFIMTFFDTLLLIYKQGDGKDVYPDLRSKQGEIEAVLYEEISNFVYKVKEGMQQYYKLDRNISGQEAFLLQQSYGFPIELIRELNKKFGKEVDEVDFAKEVQRHKELSRAGAEKKFGGHGLILDTGELKAANEEELQKVTRLHTATHLLHAALRKVLGQSVRQAGSDITAERLRFDFAFERKLTPEEIEQVEEVVNDAVENDYTVTKEELPYEEALKTGALSFFKLKYPPKVNVYSVGDVSKELCGGPHVQHSGEIGKFKIIKEEAVSAGTRRIRATVQ
jgi:alanyl-tRNA synthetase